ncbi:MAG: methyltransferase domain-containing protein [Solirubrobacteraceae bacterium]
MESAGIQHLQEFAYAPGYDYRRDAPHLKHPQLYDWLASSLREEVRRLQAVGLPATVLEVGAGDGAFVEPLLATGAMVRATEMSRPSIDVLHARFGMNPSFEVAFDPDGSMSGTGDERFALILYASVLHHIPDYLSAVADACERHLLPGGTLLSFQDPLRYASLHRGVRVTSDAMYLSWRLTRGNLLRGVASRGRRMRNQLSADEPSDMVEYHVVRDGVDQDAIQRLLAPRFANVEVTKYWSNHATVWQRTGERLGLVNTFAVRARDHGRVSAE